MFLTKAWNNFPQHSIVISPSLMKGIKCNQGNQDTHAHQLTIELTLF